MNRSSFAMCAALLVLALGPGACSKTTGSNSNLISDSYTETGMLNPVVVVGARPDFVLDEVVVTAPARRLEVGTTTVRLVAPGLARFEVLVFGPTADFANQQGKQLADLRLDGYRRMPRYSQRLGTDGVRPTESR